MVRVRAPARGEWIATLFKAVFSRFLARLSMRRDFLGKVLQRNAPCRLLNRPKLWNKSPLFRKKLPRFLKNLHRFRENLPRFWENLHHFFSPLLRIELHFFWRGERNHEFLRFRFDVLKRGSPLWLTTSELVRLQRSSIRWEPKKSHSSQDEWDFYCSAQCWLPHQGRN